MTEFSYQVTYTVDEHVPGLSKAEVPEGHGACNALLLVSIVRPPGGSYSQMFVGVDPTAETGRLSPKDTFKAWFMMAKALSDMPGLDKARKQLAQDAWDAGCLMFFGKKAAS